MPWHTQILSDQLTLFQPGGTDYAHLITTGTPGLSDLLTALLFSIRLLSPLFVLIFSCFDAHSHNGTETGMAEKKSIGNIQPL